jgi:LacI family transcriptional regulator
VGQREVAHELVQVCLAERAAQRTDRGPAEARRLVRAGGQTRPGQAIAELGYRPSASARALRRGRSDEICVALGLEPFFIDVMRAMYERAVQLGYALAPYLGGHERDGDDSPKQPGLGAYLFNHRPAGVVTCPGALSIAELDQARRLWNLHCVFIGLEPVAGVPTIGLPVFEAGRLAAQHLLERGHRRLGLLSPTTPVVIHHPAHLTMRRAGMLEAMRGWPEATLSCASMRPSLDDARRVVDNWLTDPQRPTGIYGYSDEYAFLLLAALHERGVRIPEDVGIVGTDNTSFCGLSYPTLTSIQFDGVRIGDRAMDMLHALVHDQPLSPALAQAPSPRLIERGSS